MKVTHYFIAISTLLLFATGCVSKKKYLEMEEAKLACDSSLTAMTQDRNGLRADTSNLGKFLRNRQDDIADMNKRLKELNQNYNTLLNTSSAETATLSKNLASKSAENQKLADDLRRREQRVAELERVLADKERAVRELRDKVSRALLSFKEKDLTVDVRNGKVYVSLSEQLLFKSGSYNVDPKGLEALSKLADVLKEDSDINVMVEGHTDDVPLRGSQPCLQDNWDLSVLRATNIVKALVKEGANGGSVTAAGHSSYLPVQEGTTPEIRQANRRTEIILTPKLDELFRILEN